MANEKNLIPNSQRTPEELREMTRKGGIASGAARRRKRELREAADLLLSRKAPPELSQGLKKLGISAADSDLQMAMLAAMVTKAIKGSTKAAELIFSLVNQEENTAKTAVTKADMDDVTAFIREVNHADEG